MTPTPTVSALTVYPVKSLGGMAVQEATAEGRGFRWDRRFMVVTPDGQFVTRRECRAMATLSAGVRGDTVVLGGEGREPLALSPESIQERGTPRTVVVWRTQVEALDAGSAAAEWLSDALNRTVELVLMPESTKRPVNPLHDRGGDVVSFADGYPYLVVSEASLADLNERLVTPVPMNRFRPNIVVQDVSAYAEDGWTGFRIGQVPFLGVKPCARCVMTTVDPDAPETRSREPLATLARYRSTEGGVMFGLNALCDRPGVVRVGDSVRSL